MKKEHLQPRLASPTYMHSIADNPTVWDVYDMGQGAFLWVERDRSPYVGFSTDCLEPPVDFASVSDSKARKIIKA